MPRLRRLILALLTLALTPLLALLAAALVFVNLARRAAALFQSPPADPATQPSGLATIVILNWNGKELLARGLPSVLDAVRDDGRDHEVLVVDNGSTDGSAEFLAREFPQVRVVPLAENLGFGAGNNAGVRAARHEVVVLLNNDMVVARGFLRPLLDGFGPDTFAVSSQIFLRDASVRREETGRTAAVFRRGMIDYSHTPLDGRTFDRRYYPAFWAGGGSSAFHRARFLALGGFADDYSPAYVEDTDLSYRAWKRGWEILFAPASVVYHEHRASTSRRFPPSALRTLVQRNQLLFIWRNIRDWRMLLAHCFFLPWNWYRLGRDSGPSIWTAFMRAATRLPSVLAAGLRSGGACPRSDREVFFLLAKPARFFAARRGQGRFSPRRDDDPRPRILWLTAYLPHQGRHAGAGRMFQLLKRVAAGYRVTLLSFLETDDERKFLPEIESLCERVIAMRRCPPARWQLFPYEPFDEFLTHGMEEALQECLDEHDYGLMQLEYTQMAAYADKSLGMPALLTKHEVDFAACARRARVERRWWNKVRWFYNYLQVLEREIRLQRRIDAAICMTDEDARALRRFCPSVSVEVVNTGVDLDYFSPSPPAETPRLVFVGAFQHLPNVDAMSWFCGDILPLVREQVPSVEMLVVGSNPGPQVARLAEVPGVRVTGFVNDIRPWMASSAVYVVPLRLGVGIRGKILEAWSMSMPVVATPVACAGLRCENGRNILTAESAPEFAGRVLTLLRDAGLRERLGKEGRKTAEEYYGWEASAQKLEVLYRRWAGSPRPGADARDKMIEANQKV